MNWDAIGAIAEMLAAIAVIITLLYLAVQIRAQTKEARLAATRDLARDYRELLRLVGTDEKTFSVYKIAIRAYEDLSEDDRIRAHLLFSQFLRIIELQYLHMKQGTLDPAFFEVWERRIHELGALPGMRHYWENNKEDYSPDFTLYINELYGMAGQSR